eukprot:6536845-Karenia_brevis.AAC.1
MCIRDSITEEGHSDNNTMLESGRVSRELSGTSTIVELDKLVITRATDIARSLATCQAELSDYFTTSRNECKTVNKGSRGIGSL